MTVAAFTISALAGVALVLLSLATLARPAIHFWPPPRTDSWQYRLFWSLFRIMVAGLLLLCVIDYGGLGRPEVWQTILALVLGALGFGLAFHITHSLGWEEAHGEAGGLNTTGWYAWSRNPVYLVSIFGMGGIGLAVHSAYVDWLLTLWALIYIAAPFLEEPWLEQQYGEEYSRYRARVARFVGPRKEES